LEEDIMAISAHSLQVRKTDRKVALQRRLKEKPKGQKEI
jgi:hypothetical protein